MSFTIGKIRRYDASNVFFSKMTAAAKKQLNSKILNAKEPIRKRVKARLREELENHRAIKGLRGKFAGDRTGYDLQAEFGLKDSERQALIDQVMTSILKYIDIQLEPSLRGNVPTKIVVDIFDRNKYESELSSEYKYTSTEQAAYEEGKKNRPSASFKPNSTTVEWMKLLLNHNEVSSISPDVTTYGINYALDFKGRFFSRSGRALMVSETAKRRYGAIKFPYSTPKGAVPVYSGSQDFIQDVAKFPGLKDAITLMIAKEAFRGLSSRHGAFPGL